MTADALTSTDPVSQLASLTESARGYADEARAPATRRAYRGGWRAWVVWCGDHNIVPMPASPESIAVYLAALADRGCAVATIERALVAISQAHRMAGHPSPRSNEALRSVLKGIRRRCGVAPRQKMALLPEQLREMIALLPENRRGARDRALLLIGFAGALRRSELVALKLADAKFSADGLIITIRRSKADQEGAGREIGIPPGGRAETCPVRALRAWLDVSGIHEGPLFRAVDRHGRVAANRMEAGSVARAVQRAAADAGLEARLFGGHSLRAGLVTAAARAGKAERVIMEQTGHRTVMMLRRYIRRGSLFVDNPAAGIGL